MKSPVKLLVDFNNCDMQGRVRLNTVGSLRNLKGLDIALKPGLKVLLDDDEGLSIDGILEFSEKENIWVAEFDWDKLNNIFPNIGC